MTSRARRREDPLAVGDVSGRRFVQRHIEGVQIRDDGAQFGVRRVARGHLGAGDAATDGLKYAIVGRAVREDDGQVGAVHAFRVDAMAVGAPRLKQSRAFRHRAALRRLRRTSRAAGENGKDNGE